ncbi:MAG: DUF1501 domain-containing protein [Pirellulales bacterium]
MLNRRDFLRCQIGAGTLMAFGATVPGFLASTARADDKQNQEKILVVVELTGGNDGLNTVIPYADDLYHKARPKLHYEKRDVLVLSDHVGFHPSLRPLKELYDQGQVAVVQGVGYPNPNRSHFESMDIWQSADPSRKIADGWLGRSLNFVKAPDGRMPAIHVAQRPVPLALRGSPTAVPTIHPNKPLELVLGGPNAAPGGDLDRESSGPLVRTEKDNAASERRKLIDKLAEVTSPSAGSMLQFVRRTSLDTYTTLDRLQTILGDFKTPEGQPEFTGGQFRYAREGLGYELNLVARLIEADFGARLYYVALDGFDTHGNQKGSHAELLSKLAGAVQEFFSILEQSQDASRVVLLTYSEFGRRVNENGSQGTDHGSGSNLLVVGPSVKGGVVGDHPSLKADDLTAGDLKFHTDFRRVYSTLLDQWLGCDSGRVLGGQFEHLKLLT